MFHYDMTTKVVQQKYEGQKRSITVAASGIMYFNKALGDRCVRQNKSRALNVIDIFGATVGPELTLLASTMFGISYNEYENRIFLMDPCQNRVNAMCF